ncbi:acetyltransferase domain-containing protein [Apiospora aurea]|uniref:Acetyltransferase domain-containing protein n=1 Tax=Apiospora aurea TaxID=335848 RepID=A0ABR1QQJ2_9PEZI
MAASSNMIRVKTTLPKQPFLPNADRQPIQTERLLVRALTQDDLQAMHELRTQPEVMIFTARGIVDTDIAQAQERLDSFLPPRGDLETYNTAVCLAATGELIGLGGVHRVASPVLGWPELGYQLKREHWGKGYATEFLRAFLERWWALPRVEVEIEVDALSVAAADCSGGSQDGDGERVVPEMLAAMVDANNPGSWRVMQKAGFEQFKEWKEPDSRVGFEGKDVTLFGYACTAKGRKSDVQ